MTKLKLQKQRSAYAEENLIGKFTRFISIFHGKLEARIFTTEVGRKGCVVNKDDDDSERIEDINVERG